MKLQTVFDIAARHALRNESGAMALADARATARRGRDRDAAGRALDSIKYTVGVLHEDYKRAAEIAANL